MSALGLEERQKIFLSLPSFIVSDSGEMLGGARSTEKQDWVTIIVCSEGQQQPGEAHTLNFPLVESGADPEKKEGGGGGGGGGAELGI